MRGERRARRKKWSKMLHKIHSREFLFHAKHEFMAIFHTIRAEFLMKYFLHILDFRAHTHIVQCSTFILECVWVTFSLQIS